MHVYRLLFCVVAGGDLGELTGGRRVGTLARRVSSVVLCFFSPLLLYCIVHGRHEADPSASRIRGYFSPRSDNSPTRPHFSTTSREAHGCDHKHDADCQSPFTGSRRKSSGSSDTIGSNHGWRGPEENTRAQDSRVSPVLNSSGWRGRRRGS